MAQNCKICNSQARSTPIANARSVTAIECPVCGKYDITDSANHSSLGPDISSDEKALFSAYLRNSSERGDIIRIDSNVLRDMNLTVTPLKNVSFSEKIDRIVLFIGDKTKQIGNPVPIENTYPLFYLRNHEELTSVLQMMSQMGLGKKIGSNFILAAEGWKKYDSLRHKRIDSKKVFVAMCFKPELLNVFIDGISPACQECGFEAIRVDQDEHNQKICDKIIAEIKTSRFMIADFTDPRHGVYFEAGFASGLGIPVIWTCNSADVSKLHFDTRQYNHIIWEATEDLKEKLINRIKAIIK